MGVTDTELTLRSSGIVKNVSLEEVFARQPVSLLLLGFYHPLLLELVLDEGVVIVHDTSVNLEQTCTVVNLRRSFLVSCLHLVEGSLKVSFLLALLGSLPFDLCLLSLMTSSFSR